MSNVVSNKKIPVLINTQQSIRFWFSFYIYIYFPQSLPLSLSLYLSRTSLSLCPLEPNSSFSLFLCLSLCSFLCHTQNTHRTPFSQFLTPFFHSHGVSYLLTNKHALTPSSSSSSSSSCNFSVT